MTSGMGIVTNMSRTLLDSGEEQTQRHAGAFVTAAILPLQITRNDVLGAQLVNVRFKPGTRDCKVIGGTLHDPYTGKTIEFDPAKGSAIQIDHVVSVAS